MIEARAGKQIGETLAFDFELEASKGITALLGAAGAGKSFVLDAIAGFARPDSGRILLDDQILFDGVAKVFVRPQLRRCGYVSREASLFPHLTLRGNLEFAAGNQPRLERHRRANELLEKFGLTSVSEHKAKDLSLSQSRCGSIARALMATPRALLLDDPAQGLDPAGRAGLYAAVRCAREEQAIPILLATRDLSDCCELADQMLVLGAGRVLESGAPAKILSQPGNLDVARLLGFDNLLPAEIVALDPGRDSSRLRLETAEILGPYFPGRFRGDRVWLVMRAEELRALPRDGAKPGPNQVAAKLLRAAILPHAVRLEFEGGLAAVCSRVELDRQRDNKEWLVEFPAESVRIV